MPKRNDSQREVTPWTVTGEPWALVEAMLHKEAERGGSEADADSFFGCWSAVKNVYKAHDSTGAECICWIRYGKALNGPYESQRIARKTTCPGCDREVANLRPLSLERFTKSMVCNDCGRDLKRMKDRVRAKAYRKRHGLALAHGLATCEHCGESYARKRSTSRYCSTRCRVAAHRAQAAAGT